MCSTTTDDTHNGCCIDATLDNACRLLNDELSSLYDFGDVIITKDALIILKDIIINRERKKNREKDMIIKQLLHEKDELKHSLFQVLAHKSCAALAEIL